jgi:hypothetical protein
MNVIKVTFPLGDRYRPGDRVGVFTGAAGWLPGTISHFSSRAHQMGTSVVTHVDLDEPQLQGPYCYKVSDDGQVQDYARDTGVADGCLRELYIPKNVSQTA